MASEERYSAIEKMLNDKGYTLARISGSHHIFTKPNEPLLSIPVHGGKVKPYYVKQIKKL